MWRRYILWFAHEYVEFRSSEIQSIISMFNIPIRYVEQPSVLKPYWIVEFPEEEYVKKLASRSVLLKNCIELWSLAKSNELLHTSLKEAMKNDTNKWIIKNSNNSKINDSQICPKSLIESCCKSKKSFKVEVETFCKHYTMSEKVSLIQKFDYLPLEGPVDLKKPDTTLSYIEFYGVEPNNVPDAPYKVFFGRSVAEGQRHLINIHTLKKRQFIGNTSMDAQLALIMANQAKVTNGDLILDPFVGSGSLFVAAAHFGAYVWGSDIDYMMLHARTRPTRVGQKVRSKEESIKGNMSQYGTRSRYLDVVVSDFSSPLWRSELKFQAILTDPPYGVREPTERIGIERDNYTISDAHLVNHVPSKVEYGLSQLYRDLLNFSAKHLEMGRRLVCWYPIVREDYDESQLPSHPCLSLVANSEQVLSKLTSRRLLTYEKIKQEDIELPPIQDDEGVTNFRDKYFEMGERQSRERKLQRSQEIVANAVARANKIKNSCS